MKTEARIQQNCVIWFTNNYCLKHHQPRFHIFAVPNGGTRNIREATQLKRTGTVAGVSDLIVLLDGKAVFVEVKTVKGKLSPKQDDFNERVTALGFDYIVVRSLEDFKTKIFYLINK